MGYEYDVFISYANIGDPNLEIANEWSVKFSRFLDDLLNRLLHEKPVLLLNSDLDIRKKMLNISSEEIFTKTAVFVTILTPDYLKSESYVKELERIYDIVYSDHAAKNIPRIFKVIILPVSVEDQPTCLQYEINYDFYEINPKSRKAVSFDISSNTSPKDIFWSKLIDLAYDISNSLALLKSGKKQEDDSSKETIYLASTSPDQEIQRDIIKRELKQLGYNVVPNFQLPRESEKLKMVIKKYLEESCMSIHIIGGYYGDYLKNSQYSLIDLQNRLVKEYINDQHKTQNSGNPKLTRIIWIPPDLRPADERQVLYIARLRRDDAFEDSEVVETPIEELKTVINNKLVQRREQELLDEKCECAYVIYEQKNKETIKELINTLKDKDINVLIPDYEGQETNVLSNHWSNMVKANRLFIYYNGENQSWLYSKLNDVIKVPGYGKNEDFDRIDVLTLTDDIYVPEELKEKINIINIQGEKIQMVLNSILSETEK